MYVFLQHMGALVNVNFGDDRNSKPARSQGVTLTISYFLFIFYFSSGTSFPLSKNTQLHNSPTQKKRLP